MYGVVSGLVRSLLILSGEGPCLRLDAHMFALPNDFISS